MHFNNAVALLLPLLGVTSAHPLKRAVSDIESALSTVSGDIDTLDSNVNAFTGSFFQALGLLGNFNTLKGDINTATSDVTSTGALSASDSSTVYSTVSSLTGQITTVLSDAKAKVSGSKEHAVHNSRILNGCLRRPQPSRPLVIAVRLKTLCRLYR